MYWMKDTKGENDLVSPRTIDGLMALGLIVKAERVAPNRGVCRIKLTEFGESYALLLHLNAMPEEHYAYA